MDYLIFIDGTSGENLPDAFRENADGYACVGDPTNGGDGELTCLCVYGVDDINWLNDPNIYIVGELNGVENISDLQNISTTADGVVWLKTKLSEHTQLPDPVIGNMDLSTTFEVIARCSVFFGFPPGQAYQELTGLEP